MPRLLPHLRQISTSLARFGRPRAGQGGSLHERELWLALLLAIPALLPLAAPGYFFHAHDARHSVFFLVEFDQAIRDGVWWPTWAPDQAVGFGYPLWLLYAPLAYFIAELFHLIGLGFTAAVKATWAAAFVVGGVGAYRLARRWWGPAAGLIASLTYTYAPYHLVQIYVRAALAEFVALAWFPWVLLALASLWEEPRPWRAGLASLGLAALLLTHTVSALVFIPLLVAFLLLRFLHTWRAGHPRDAAGKQVSLAPGESVGLSRRAVWSAGSLALGGLLAAIFLLPMVLERRFVSEAQWVHATYDYSLHFVYPGQLFSPFWGFGYSVEGAKDAMSFQLGLLSLVAATAGTIAALAGPLPRRAEALFLAGASAIAILAMMPITQPAWAALPLVSLIQFPWRLLGLTAVTLALLAGAGIAWLEGQGATSTQVGPYTCLLALAVVAAAFPYTWPELLPVRPADETPRAVVEFEIEYPDMRGMTRWSERLPTDADSPLIAQYLAGEPLRRAAIIAGEGRILSQRSAGASAYAHVLAETPVRLRFYTYYFPGWQATVNGQPWTITADPPNGLIGLDLPAGEHEVRLRFGSTPLRRAAGFISGFAAIVWLGLMVADRAPRPGSHLPSGGPCGRIKAV